MQSGLRVESVVQYQYHQRGWVQYYRYAQIISNKTSILAINQSLSSGGEKQLKKTVRSVKGKYKQD